MIKRIVANIVIVFCWGGFPANGWTNPKVFFGRKLSALPSQFQLITINRFGGVREQKKISQCFRKLKFEIVIIFIFSQATTEEGKDEDHTSNNSVSAPGANMNLGRILMIFF